MKALFTPKSAKEIALIVITVILATPWIYPEVVLASSLQTNGQNAQVFEIKITNPNLIQPQNPKNNQTTSITMEEVIKNDPLVSKLQDYLETKKSPLAPFAADLITYPKWERALAISLVESHMCRFTPKVKTKAGWIESYNCSGIGGSNYRMYNGYMGWFADMNNLLTKPNYINRPIEKFINYYVQPGSMNWLNGVRKVEAQLGVIRQEANFERLSLSDTEADTQVHTGSYTTALATFPELTN